MNCIGFPKIFKGNSTIVKTGLDATKECLHLLASSEANSLFGDPEFGVKLKKYMFEQNNYVLRDILIDELYEKITIFCPQLFIDRKNIKITQINNKLYANIKATNRVDFTTSMFSLALFDEEEL